MTTAAPADSPVEGRPAHPAPPRPDCDPDLLDSLPCEAKGIEARAQYNKDHEAALTQARAQYDGAREAYAAARASAGPLVAEARQQLEKLLEQLDCLIGDADELRKLERAWRKVKAELKAHDKWGCYLTTDCDFDDDVQDCPLEDVPSRIADIARRVGEAEAFFAVLVEEPTKLADRVAKVQAEIADIDAKVKAGPTPEDQLALYAAALVARLHLNTIWGGFRDVDEYMDCLCGALTCSFKGHAAISELMQQQAVEACREQSAAAYLTWLREHTAEAVMAEYHRMSAEYGDGGQQPPDDGGYGDDEPPDGGDGGYGQGEPPDGGDGGYGQGEPPDGGDGGYGEGEPPDGGDGGYGEGEPPDQGGGYGDRRRGRNNPKNRGGYGRQDPRYGPRQGSGRYRDKPGDSRS
jgi:hypothetical protein